MQTDLVSRMEKIWGMAEIALRQGQVDYGTDGHSRVARFSGLTFRFLGDRIVRIRGAKLDIAIRHLDAGDANIAFFPGAQTRIEFLTGDHDTLDVMHREFTALQTMLSVRKAA